MVYDLDSSALRRFAVFFKKLFVKPEWGEARRQTRALIPRAELTERVDVLLGQQLVAGIEAEIAALETATAPQDLVGNPTGRLLVIGVRTS
jgi:hypothetical protein